MKLDTGNLPDVGGKHLGALDVIASVDLFVLRVCTIIGRAHRQQHHILAGGLLEGERHRDRTTFAGKVGLDIENYEK